MHPQVTNIIIMGVMMLISRFLDMENPKTVMIIRIMYCTSMATAFIIYQITRSRIVKKNDLTTMKFVAQGNTLLGEGEKLEVTTVKNYDLKDIDGCLKSWYTSIATMCFMHLYMGYSNPLFMQSISPIKGALEDNVVKIHLFGKPATGMLKRPFRSIPLFGGVNTGADPKTDKKTIEQMERSGNGGVKKYD